VMMSVLVVLSAATRPRATQLGRAIRLRNVGAGRDLGVGKAILLQELLDRRHEQVWRGVS